MLEYYKNLRRNILETFYYITVSIYYEEKNSDGLHEKGQDLESLMKNGMIKNILDFIEITLNNFKNNIDYVSF